MFKSSGSGNFPGPSARTMRSKGFLLGAFEIAFDAYASSGKWSAAVWAGEQKDVRVLVILGHDSPSKSCEGN
jgi:hypothetical protein